MSVAVPFLPLREHLASSCLPKIQCFAKFIVKLRSELELVPVFSRRTSSTGRCFGGVAKGGGSGGGPSGSDGGSGGGLGGSDGVGGYGLKSGDESAGDGCCTDGMMQASSSVVKPSQKLLSDIISSMASSRLVLAGSRAGAE